MVTDRGVFAVLLLCFAAACGDSEDAALSASGGPDFPSDTGGVGNVPGGSGTPDPTAGRPPEQETENRFLSPVVTGRYLWTANRLSGRVAFIDATTLAVSLETAGAGPSRVAGLPDLDGRYGALVLNEQSDDATLFRIDDAGRVDKLSLETHADANSWSVSPSGRFAVAWGDAALVNGADPLETFQDVSVLGLEPGRETSTPLSVGARPSAVAFDAAEEHAYVVTEQGISPIELGDEPEVTGLIPVSDDPLADPALFDVSFSPDGSFATVRVDGRPELVVIALPDGTRSSVVFDSPVTDVDLSPDGARAYVVLGFAAEIVTVPLPVQGEGSDILPRLTLEGETIGAIALNRDATAAVAYSTVLGTARVSLLATTAEGELALERSMDLISPVSAVFAAPDREHAVAFQSPAAGSSKAGAFSLLVFGADRAPKIVATDATPTQIAFSEADDAALIAVRSDELGTFGAYVVALDSGQVDFVGLGSAPEAAGIVEAAGRAFVAQAHPEGRVTFVTLSDGTLRTLTGFELAARIREE